VSLNISYEIISDLNQQCDLEFVSVFPPRKLKLSTQLSRIVNTFPVGELDLSYSYDLRNGPQSKNYKRRIWYTGENIRPPLEGNYDGYLSFDVDNFVEGNAYLPLWFMHIGIFGAVNEKRLGLEARLDNFLNPRIPNYKGNRKLCAIASNHHSVRLHALASASRFFHVDAYGRGFREDHRTKFAIYQDYDFGLCFENDLYPGYVTEKLVDAYLSGVIPLYWGLIPDHSCLNKDAFLNLNDFETIDSFIEFAGEIDSERAKDIISKPLLINLPNLESIKNVILG
jgi:hypothetical protein